MDRCTQSPSGALLRALGEFNRGDWFECHETLISLGAERMAELDTGLIPLLRLVPATGAEP